MAKSSKAKVVGVRLTATDYADIHRVARKENRTVSDWLRIVVKRVLEQGVPGL